MKKILLVTPYFGNPPLNFQLWLDSCAWNRQISWLFITDIDMKAFDVPANVIIRKSTLPELRLHLNRRSKFPLRYRNGWGFCALRCGIGKFFEDDLKGYDYWGWCDQDMLYGDLSRCFSVVARGADKILPKGHLSLVKNDIHLIDRIMAHPLTRMAMEESSLGLPCFDEVGFRDVVLPECGAVQDDSLPFVNTACRPGHFVLEESDRLAYLLARPEWRRIPFVVTIDRGRMTAHFALEDENVKRIEVLYFHFFRRDMKSSVTRLSKDKCYLIRPNVIEAYDGHLLSRIEIVRMNRFRIHWRYWRKRLNWQTIYRKARTLLMRI